MSTEMTPWYTSDGVALHHGDCLDVLREVPDNSVDSVVTDPPCGIRFMGKPWDGLDIEAGIERRRSQAAMPDDGKAGENGGYRSAATEAGRYDLSMTANQAFQAWCEEWARECLRILKPGGHLVSFGGSRTWHRLSSAVEDAGFEIRDSIAWIYGSGFPKSLDVSKAIDKAAGAERKVVGSTSAGASSLQRVSRVEQGYRDNLTAVTPESIPITAPATKAAQQWQGWGTALKPAFEPIVVGRKPIDGTVAANVLEYGTGALNIDGCRVPPTGESRLRISEASQETRYTEQGGTNFAAKPGIRGGDPSGRWPTNVVLDESQAAELDAQTGTLTSGKGNVRRESGSDRAGNTSHGAESRPAGSEMVSYGDSGGASRFFPVFRYQAKAPSSERPTYWAHVCDCEHDQPMQPGGTCRTCGQPGEKVAHPTVKPLDYMRWLVRLVTPPGGTVLEPFTGSGTTVEACVLEGFTCIAIEKEADYLPLTVNRLDRRLDPVAAIRSAKTDSDPDTLFDLQTEESA